MEDTSKAHTTSGMTAPIVDLAAPVAATRTRSTTRIEGMEALESAEARELRHSITAEELSFYSQSENEHGDDNIWGLLSGVGGNIYEW